MSFVKLYQVIVDGPLGYQTVNQLSDNAEEMRTVMYVEHGSHDPSLSTVKGSNAFNYSVLGRHDLDEIPRSVGFALLFQQTLNTTNVAFSWSGVGIPSVWRAGVGGYLLPVLGLSTFWAVASASGDGSSVLLAPQVRPFHATKANGNNAGLRINTYSLASGNFDLADMSFGIALYGTP